MKVEYLIGERNSGRTTDVVAEMIRDNAAGRRVLYVAPRFSSVVGVKMLLGQFNMRDAMDRNEIMLATSVTLVNRRGYIIHTLYIDDAEHVDPGFLDLASTIDPQRVVVVLTGSVFKRESHEVAAR